MISVWKYPLATAEKHEIELPVGAKILKLGVQKGVPTLWVQVTPWQTQVETRKFSFVGTGHKREDLDDATYIDTILLMDEALVLHLYEYPRGK